ncbi:phosphate acetyltransferase [Clostridium cellulovorans]|uniref:Phosphate acetyltransferase n=1 Tax=Clostridium cellulovorans (strain ATCC 35296 / DSM 3052 / OCM 3 / 743B) TaxID=573061 RepID=D9SLB9_CLOC7|nr:phosphate acetyltransferase [Clostridium cellulovorans]ADL51635.1 phosphate acetyltransferase [Clostridium cellulovorans 743B]
MEFMQKIWKQARSSKRRIVLAEGEERRNLIAAGKIIENNLADIILVGDTNAIKENAEALGVDIREATIADQHTYPHKEEMIKELYEIRKSKGMTLEKAAELVLDPLYFGTMMVKMGYGDGMVSGAIHTTGDLLRPGLQIIKTAPGVSAVSGFFVMVIPNCNYGENGTLIFADCAVNPKPTSEQLASIAITTAETAEKFDLDPKVAMLSFSTMGSASHEMVDNVRNAVDMAKSLRPDLAIDGELQLDAAIVPDVAELKAPNSPVAGKANVLIFPDLQTGNIGYKLVQRFARAEAIGPICQGFAKPINDLSRGCSPEDIVNVVAMTAVQAQKGI